jgi:hypothetical protein
VAGHRLERVEFVLGNRPDGVTLRQRSPPVRDPGQRIGAGLVR